MFAELLIGWQMMIWSQCSLASENYRVEGRKRKEGKVREEQESECDEKKGGQARGGRHMPGSYSSSRSSRSSSGQTRPPPAEVGSSGSTERALRASGALGAVRMLL